MKTIISPIGVDLGAKNTGVYSSSYLINESWEDTNHYGYVIIDSGKKKWSQSERTANRHVRRSIQRRKLAKRLFKVLLPIVDSSLQADKVLLEFLVGLLNRRGYTYASAKPETFYDELLEKYREELEWFFDENFSTGHEVEERIFTLWQNKIPLKEVEENGENKTRLKLKKEIESIFSDYTKAIDEGHKHRKVYLKNIKNDLEHKSLGHLYHLIGNISNFQLRFLRRYFNDESFKKGDAWDEVKFNKVLERYLSAWHVKSTEEKEALKRIRNLKGLDFLLQANPEDTIPPFEDQNNRDPLRCYTLVLKADSLDKYLPSWDRKYHRAFEDSFCLGMTKEHKRNELARQFQFYLDSQGKLDEKGKDKVLNHLAQGSDDKDLRLFLDQYEKERKESRYGFWGDEKTVNKILKVCEQKTGHKSKAQGSNLEAIFGYRVSVEGLKKEISETKIKGNRGLKGVLESCSKLQKSYGNRLKYEWRNETFEKKLKDEIKSIPEHFPRDVFQLGQIFNILFGEIHGFASSCRFCASDNALRMKVDSEGKARAFRLATTSSRPFDGVVARLLDSIAWEIVKRKVEEVNRIATPGDKIILPLAIEENSFDFQESLLSIKKNSNKKSKKKTSNSKESLYGEVESKWERIENDSKGICPYTGVSLGEGGEFDHIIPRSFTKRKIQTVFNSELNLIYVSAEGNRLKGNKQKSLSELNSKYLQKQFGTSNVSDIVKEISSTWESLKNKPIYFNTLSIEERRDICHALFIPNLKNEVMDKMNMLTKTKVNGTQKYLASLIKEKLEQELRDYELHIDPRFVDVRERYDERELLASINKKYRKEEKQELMSHVIDATLCSYISCGEDVDKEKIIPKEFEMVELTSIPKSAKKDPCSKKLFADQLVAERYQVLFAKRKENGGMSWAKGQNFKSAEFLKKSEEKLLKDLVGEEVLTYRDKTLKTLENISEGEYLVLRRQFFHEKLDEAYHQDKEKFRQLSILRNLLVYKTKKVDVVEKLTEFFKKNKNATYQDFLKTLDKDNKKLSHYGHWQALIIYLEKNLSMWNEEQGALEVRKYFMREKTESELSHKKVRKKYSLPLSTTDGSIRRKTRNGTYQLMKPEGEDHSGLVKVGNKLEKIPSDVYYASKNLTPIKELVIPEGTPLPSDWFVIDQEKIPFDFIQKIEIKTNDVSRAFVRIYLKKDLGGESFEYLEEKLGKDLFSPRDNNFDYKGRVISFTHNRVNKIIGLLP